MYKRQRPHIVKCAYTGKYVCWIKHCGDNACFTVLQADKFLGPYEIVKAHYRPFGCEVGDFDIAVCGDTAYLYKMCIRDRLYTVGYTIQKDGCFL